LSNIPALPGAIGQATPTVAAGASAYAGVLRAGLLMGRITDSPTTVAKSAAISSTLKNFFRPSIIGTITSATVSTSATFCTVTAQCYIELKRLYALGITTFYMIGTDSTTATTLRTSTFVLGTPFFTDATFTITFTGLSLGGTITTGGFICPADGSQNPVSFVDEQFGLNMQDINGNNVLAGTATGLNLAASPFPRVPLAGGLVNVLNIVNYPASTLTAQVAWLKGNLNSGGGLGCTAGSTPVNYGGKFNFTDDYGL
jgi:hypothetical protein